MDTVALAKYKDDIKSSLEEGVNLIAGFRSLQSPVLLKPNICTITDKTGFSVTDVKTVEALLTLLFHEDPNLSIQIVESDSQSKWARQAFDKFGYTKLAESFQKCLL